MAVICLKDACGYMIVIVALLYSTRYIQYAIVIRLVNWHRIERRVIYVLCCYRRTETVRQMIFMAEIQNSSTFLSTYPSLRFGLHTHTMSELALTTEKGSKSFDHSKFFFMHWTK